MTVHPPDPETHLEATDPFVHGTGSRRQQKTKDVEKDANTVKRERLIPGMNIDNNFNVLTKPSMLYVLHVHVSLLAGLLRERQAPVEHVYFS
jgi:hypothetical protein